jgi:uncharacterized protein (DUF2147 family)
MKPIFFRAGYVAVAALVIAAAIAAPLQAAPQQVLPSHAQGAAPQAGRWLTESGNLEIDIAPCGEALCGTVARVVDNRSMSQPGAAMQAAGGQGRSPLGMQVLSDFTPAGGGAWKGRIYNRENGETYDCLIELLAPDQLKVHAYKGTPAQGRTQVWRRVGGAGQ